MQLGQWCSSQLKAVIKQYLYVLYMDKLVTTVSPYAQLLVLLLALLSYFTMFQSTIHEFPVKKEPDGPPPHWGR